MSIYIKNMEMPITYPLMVTIYPNGQVLSETVGAKDKYGFAVRVPPHGRLIDADKLENIVFESLNNAITDCNPTPFGEALCMSIAKNIVDEIGFAPTIIQADKPKKEVSDDNVILKTEEK